MNRVQSTAAPFVPEDVILEFEDRGLTSSVQPEMIIRNSRY
jgi:hypothetical protein